MKRSALAVGAILAMVLPQPLSAQALSPMRGHIVSLDDAFVARVTIRNPYPHPISVSLQVYDERYRKVPFLARRARLRIPGGDAARGVVMVPFEGHRTRKVRVCARSIPFRPRANAATVRANICGRFLGERR